MKRIGNSANVLPGPRLTTCQWEGDKCTTLQFCMDVTEVKGQICARDEVRVIN